MTDSSLIDNAEALTRIFGHWPSFHDAEVLSMHLDRDGDGGPSLEARIHVFEMTSQVDARGFYILTHHTLVTLVCSNILLRELRWFNDQNSLSGLGIYRADQTESDGRRIGLSLGANHGVEADVLCDRLTILSAEPFSPAA